MSQIILTEQQARSDQTERLDMTSFNRCRFTRSIQ